MNYTKIRRIYTSLNKTLDCMLDTTSSKVHVFSSYTEVNDNITYKTSTNNPSKPRFQNKFRRQRDDVKTDLLNR